MQLFKNTLSIDFNGLSSKTKFFSLLLIIVSSFILLMQGLNLTIEFLGGTNLNVSVSEVLEGIKSSIPSNRLGDPSEMGSLATFLASDKASYITGTAIPIDGGFLRSI